MRTHGNCPAGLEVGNAWALRPPGAKTNWVVGTGPAAPPDSFRFLPADVPASGVCVKWFVHTPADPPEWGDAKPTSTGRTLSILAGEGGFELTFAAGGERFTVVLDEPGDFAVWGPGLEHAWRPLAAATIVTVRWQPVG